jgi:uncharacterized protein YecT (DUF1311 family)
MYARIAVVGLALVIVCAVIVVRGAPADRASAPAKPAACGETTVAMNMCIGRALRRADRQLNAVYRRVLAHANLPDGRRGNLVSAERAWVAFKTADCSLAVSFFEGGSAAGPVAGACMLDHTKDRLADLRGYERLLSG